MKQVLPTLLLCTVLWPCEGVLAQSIPYVSITGWRLPPTYSAFDGAADCTFISAPSPFGHRARAGAEMAESYGWSAPFMSDGGPPPFAGADVDVARERDGVGMDRHYLPSFPSTSSSFAARSFNSFDYRCGYTSYAAGLGRAYIAARDRTWALGTEAFARGDYATAYEQFNKGYWRIGSHRHGYMAGLILYNGEGVPRDPAGAIKLFDDVALSREARFARIRFDPADPTRTNATLKATLALADIYLSGKDVPADRKMARKLLERAGDLGYMPAKLSLARLLAAGPQEGRDEQRAVRLLTEAAKAAHAPSQFALARMLEAGQGGPADPARALEWYRQAAFNLYDASVKPWAQFALARMFDRGSGTERHPAKALALYRLAAQSGHAEALAALADHVYRGEMVDKDQARARELYRAGAERGSTDAMTNLATILYKGEGGAADPEGAYSWLLIAEKAGHPRAPAAVKVLQAHLSAEQRARVEAKLLPVLSRQ